MKKSCLVLLFILVGFIGFSQDFYPPEGYSVYIHEGFQSRVDGDFDQDGIKDLAIMCQNTSGDKIMAIFLTSQYMISKTIYYFPWDYYDGAFCVFEKNGFSIMSKGSDDHVISLEFKYFQDLKNMRLVSYWEDYGGTGGEIAWGAFDKKINLLDNSYTMDDQSKEKHTCIIPEVITLSNISKYFNYLKAIGK